MALSQNQIITADTGATTSSVASTTPRTQIVTVSFVRQSNSLFVSSTSLSVIQVAATTFLSGPSGPSTVAGLITAGTNITITGAGTNVSPYAISSTSSGGSGADATTTAKGVVQLAGDLAGTAASPTVPSLLLKAPINSPTFTGTPITTTPTAGDNTTKIASTAFVTTAIINAASTYDDVKEYANLAAFPATGTTGTIYVADDTGYLYRWSGSTYVQVGGGTPADATTSSKGIIQLAGDLGGTATSPTTPTAVHITGNETVGGIKSFSANIAANAGITLATSTGIVGMINTSAGIKTPMIYPIVTFDPEVGWAVDQIYIRGGRFDVDPLDSKVEFRVHDNSSFAVYKAGGDSQGNMFKINNDKSFEIYNDLHMNTHQIQNVIDPSNAQDAATKNYVDINIRPRVITSIGASLTGGVATKTDYYYYYTGSTAYTFTLPTAVGNTNLYTVKNNSSITQSIATTSSQTIDTTTSKTVNPTQSLQFLSTGSNWIII